VVRGGCEVGEGEGERGAMISVLPLHSIIPSSTPTIFILFFHCLNFLKP
jgi:hypothetical protein